jgi:hypothetical protein
VLVDAFGEIIFGLCGELSPPQPEGMKVWPKTARQTGWQTASSVGMLSCAKLSTTAKLAGIGTFIVCSISCCKGRIVCATSRCSPVYSGTGFELKIVHYQAIKKRGAIPLSEVDTPAAKKQTTEANLQVKFTSYK